jgi:putative glutamine amidotransferase
MHPLRPVPMTLLGAALEAAREVNTSHHQALDPLALAASLRVCAFSGAGVIEAVEGLAGRAPIMAVQWHPERLAGDNPAAGELLRFWKSLV